MTSSSDNVQDVAADLGVTPITSRPDTSHSSRLELMLCMSTRLRMWASVIESRTELMGRELDLMTMLARDGATSVKNLVADLGLPRSTMTAIVDRLENRGLLQRRTNPEDRRSVVLEATAAGRESLSGYCEGLRALANHVDRTLDQDEQVQLFGFLKRLAATF